jgi:hypothetical protein
MNMERYKKLADDHPTPKLALVKKPYLEPKRENRIPFNAQRKEIRALIERAWLRPYYAVAKEIDANIQDKPRESDAWTFEGWLKSLDKPWGGRRHLEMHLLDFWSACIKDNLGIETDLGWSFTWGNAKFKLYDSSLKTIYKFWKSLNKRMGKEKL